MRALVSTAMTLVLVLGMAAGWFLIGPTTTYACTCAPSGTPAEALTRSTAVFRATVVDIVEVNPWTGPLISSADPLRVTFKVDTVWKGPEQGTLEATTARSSISCGYEFEEGKNYLVYARGQEGDLQVGLCSRTRQILLALADLSELGEGRAVQSAEDATRNGPTRAFGCNTPPLTSALAHDLSLVMIIVGAAGLNLWRRLR